MIITNDKHFPRVIMRIDKFQSLELKTLMKEMEILDKRAKENNTFINYFIDLYNLSDYSFMCLTHFISFIVGKQEPMHIKKVTIYLDEMRDNSYILSIYEQYNDSIEIIIDIKEVGEPVKIK